MSSDNDVDVVVVIEFEPTGLPTGVARRYDHIVQLLADAGLRAHTLQLNDGSRKALSVRERMRRAPGRAVSGAAQYPASVPLIVIGLGTPTMLIAARAVARTGRAVVFDHCDSLQLQAFNRLRTGNPRLLAIAAWLIALHLTTPRHVRMSYISDRDERADRIINRHRLTGVAIPSAPKSLADLDAPRFPLKRIVVPIELSSHHNQRGFRMLVEAVRRLEPTVPIEIYGPTAPTDALPPGMTYRGYAPTLIDLYAGDTGVVITNIGGSGVPNKLVEAATAGRPIVMHRSLVGRWPLAGGYLLFSDVDQLGSAILRLADGPIAETRTSSNTAPTGPATRALADLITARAAPVAAGGTHVDP